MRSRSFVAVLLTIAFWGCASTPERGPRAVSRDPAESVADDLQVGMNKRDVLELWGQPQETFVAGDPRGQNEKWVYYVGLSSQLGRANSRAIYFEGGYVSGWETAHRPVK